MKQKDKCIIKWSKKERDYEVHYPDRNGRIIGKAVFGMINRWEDFMRKDWQGNPTDFKDFRTYLREGGYNPDTFKITIEPYPSESLETQE